MPKSAASQARISISSGHEVEVSKYHNEREKFVQVDNIPSERAMQLSAAVSQAKEHVVQVSRWSAV